MVMMNYPRYLRVLIFFCINTLPGMLNAQVTISAQLPPGGMVQKDQLWNLILVNNKESMEVSIQLTLQEPVTGQVLMTASTTGFVLGKGIKLLTNADVQPLRYNYNIPGLSERFLPMGSYTLCYQVSQVQGDSGEPLANECIQINIDPLSPPLLITPPDKSIIENPYPFFSWMPPTPVNMFNDLNYDIIVTEVLDGQSCTEAIQFNIPIYTRNNLSRPNENYNSGFTKLQKNKTYAWQVVAKNGLRYAVKTEVWTFTLSKEILPAVTSEINNYLLVENDLKGAYIIANKRLHIKYISTDKEHETPIIFTGANGSNMFSIVKKIMPGDNFFDLDLNNQFQKDKVYKVIITDLEGKSKVLIFSIK